MTLLRLLLRSVTMKIMETVESKINALTIIQRRPVNHIASLARVLKKVSASIGILRRFVLAFRLQVIVLVETGVEVGTHWSTHSMIIHKVPGERASILTIISTVIF